MLAGTPAEMEAAVLGAVGLPYEQFTSCVMLPQGEFARFLHAKPAERQEILVNLLGLSRLPADRASGPARPPTRGRSRRPPPTEACSATWPAPTSRAGRGRGAWPRPGRWSPTWRRRLPGWLAAAAAGEAARGAEALDAELQAGLAAVQAPGARPLGLADEVAAGTRRARRRRAPRGRRPRSRGEAAGRAGRRR